MSTEVVINVRGVADPAQVERLKGILEQMAPTLDAAFAKAAPAAEAASKAVDALSSSAGAAKGGLLGMASGLDVVVPGLGTVVKLAGAAAIAAGVMGGAMLALGASASGAFADLANKTGASGAALDGLESSLRRVGAQSTLSLGEIAPIMGELAARTEMTGPALEQLTGRVALLSKVTGTDAKQNVQLLTRMFGDWGVSTDLQAGKLDMLLTASQRTGVGIDEMSRLVVQFGAPLRNFGFSLEEGAALLGSWQQKGVNTELVMGSLRIAAGKLADAGIPLREGLEGAITAIQKAGSTSEATAIAMDIFGARAGADMADTIRGGKFAIDDLVASLDKAPGAIDRAGTEIAGLGGQFAKIKNAATVAISPITDLAFDVATRFVSQFTGPIGDLASKLGDKLAPAADSVRAFVMPLIDQAGPALAHLGDIISGVPLDALGSGFSLLGGLFKDYLAPAALLVADALGWLAEKLGPILGTAIDVVREKFAALKDWLSEHGEVVKLILIGMFTGPIGVIVTLVVKHRDDIVAAFTDLREGVSGVFTEMWSRITGAWNTGLATVQGIGAQLLAGVLGVWTGIKTGVTSLASSLITWLGQAWSSCAAFLLNIKNRIALGFQTAWNWIVTTVSNVVSRLVNWLHTTWNNFGAWVYGLLNRLSTGFGRAWAWIHDTVGGLVARLANAVTGFLHGMAQKGADLMDRLGDAFHSAWEGITGIFGGAAQRIVDGMKGLFTAIAKIARQGMTAVGSIVEKVLGAAVRWIGQFIDKLGPLGTPLKSTFAGVSDGLSGILDSLGSKFNGVVDGIGNGLDRVATAFQTKFAAARQRVASMFAGGPDQAKAEAAGEAGEAGLGWEGIGADISGLGGAGGGGTGPLGVGDTGTDGLGDFYIDENGAKVYTSGAGLARQEAKERAKEQKEAERAAKASAKGKGAKVSKDASEASAAETMARIAERVSEAWTKGMEALRSLADADLPGREKWEPKVAMVEEFISASIERFDVLASGLMAKVGETEEGADVLDTAKGRAIAAMGTLTVSMTESLSKAAGFLGSLRSAKWPTAEQVDTAMRLVGDLLTRIRDKSIELASVFTAGSEGDEEEDPVAALAAVGTSLGQWADVYGKAASLTLSLGEQASRLRSAAPALDAAERALTAIAQGAARIVGALKAAVPDEMDRESDLALARDVTETLSGQVDVIGRLAEIAGSLRAILRIPAGVADAAAGFMAEVAGTVAAMQAGLQRSLPSRTAQEEALAMARDVATTLSAVLAPVTDLASAADKLRDLARIPAGLADRVGTFMREIAGTVAAMQGEMASVLPDAGDQQEALGVGQRIGEVLGVIAGSVVATADAIRALVDLPSIADTAIPRIQATMHAVAGMLHSLVVGPGYNLLDEPTATTEALGVVQTQVATIESGVDLMATVAGLGKTLAEASPIDPAALQRAADNAVLVEATVRLLARQWIAAVEKAGAVMDEVVTQTKVYGDQLKASLSIITDAAKLAVAEVKPIDITQINLALMNAERVELRVRMWADQWVMKLELAGAKLADVLQRTKDYAGQLKETMGAVTGAAAAVVGEVKPVDLSRVQLALDNAEAVERTVRERAGGWATRLEETGRKLADVTAAAKDYGGVLKAAIDAVTGAASLALAEVKPVDEMMVEQALINAEAALTHVEMWMRERVRWLADHKRTLEDWGKEIAQYAGAAKGAVDLVISAGKAIVANVKPVSAADVAMALANADSILDQVGSAAKRWLTGITMQSRDMEGVVKETDAYVKTTGGAVDLLARINDSFRKLFEAPVQTDLSDRIRAVLANAISGVQQMAAAFAELRTAGTDLEDVDRLTETLAPAAEALSKVLEALSLEKLSKSPLIATKHLSAPDVKRRLEAIGKAITEGVRRTVKVLIDGLSGIEVPANLGEGLDRLLAVYERMVALLERVQGFAIPDADRIRQIADAAASLASAVNGAMAGATAPGGTPGAGGRSGWEGGAQTPAEGTGAGSGEMTLEMHLAPVIEMEGETMGRCMEKIIIQRGWKIALAPSGA